MKILIVDDEPASLKKMTMLLIPYGKCETADTGEKAKAFFFKSFEENERFGLVVIDIGLPDINGLELLRLICNKETETMETPSKKIVMTAQSSMDNVKKAVGMCDAFFVKPVKKDMLINKLHEIGISPPKGA